jgi:hypothetical protein
VGIGHVKDMMDEGRVEVGEELLVAAGDLWAGGGGAELAIGLEAGAMLGGGGGGDGSGYVTAEDVVARERACGDDLGEGGGEGAIGLGLELPRERLRGEEAAVGGGDVDETDGFEVEGNEGEAVGAGEEEGGAEAGAIWRAGGALLDGTSPSGDDLSAAGAVGDEGRAGGGARSLPFITALHWSRLPERRTHPHISHTVPYIDTGGCSTYRGPQL